MAVVVDKGTSAVETYPDAGHVLVDNGHLLVQTRVRGNWVNRAIHAPGSWKRAEVSGEDER